MFLRWMDRQGGRLSAAAFVGLALAVVVGVELIVSSMDWLLLHQVTWDYLLTGLVASGVAAPTSMWVLQRLLAEVARIRADHSQQELHLANDRLRLAQRGGGLVFWEYDVEAGRLLYDRAVLPLIGLPASSFQPELAKLKVHPDDRDGFEQRVQKVLSGTSDLFDFEFRMKGQQGEWVWVRARGEVGRRDPQGRALWVAGGSVNVDAQKRAQLALDAQRRLLEAMLDALPLPVFYKDAQGRYLGLNAAFMDFYGVERAQLVGRSVFDLNPPELAAIYHAKDQALFNHPGKQFYESQVRGLDGALHDVEFHKATFTDADGRVAGLVGAVVDVTERKQAEALIWRQANFDALTGLPNRRMWREQLEQALRQAARERSRLGVMYLDLDHFKDVNDTLGHDQGDVLLRQAADRIAAAVRDADTLARMGGDEFALILRAVDDGASLLRVAEQILASLAEPFQLGDHLGWVTGSIGVAFYPDDATDADTLCRCADQAMYRAKAQGRNRLSYYTAELQQQALLGARIRDDLQQALQRGEFWLAYQPIVDLADERLVKVEALLRWQHPTLGLLLPEAFIATAEESGLIHPLGDWVLAQALQQLHDWQPVLGEQLQMCINKSPVQLLARAPEHDWRRHLSAAALPAQRCVIELNETAVEHDSAALEKAVQAFRAAGVQVALHDLGAGLAAPSRLEQLRVNFIQLGRRYVRGLADNAEQRQLAGAVIDMAHALELKVVAVGVETPAQRDILRALGCDLGQGFLWAHPMPADELVTWATQRPDADSASAAQQKAVSNRTV